MAFKGFFKTIKDEVKNEIGRQIDRTVNKKGGGVEDGENGENSGKVDMSLIEGVLGLLGGGGGSGKSGLENLGNIINAIQGQTGGFLPGSVGKYLPGILKVAEIIGHGMGDDTPRNEQNADGSFVDNFIKTIVGGRKIHGGKSSFKVKPVERGADNLFHSPLRTGRHGEPRGAEAVQDYEKLKSKCLERGVLFEDSEFPAEDASVFFTRSGRRNFQWLRPHEICSDPKFFVEGATRFDVKQGELGDCWLLAAVANLTLNPALFHQIVPEDNSFINDYAGIFHFRFWQYGRWVDVVVDDRLPTFGGKLMFMHSEERNEMWSALFEKAYAKLHGSYEALKGGTTCEALEDFTGGVTEMYDIRTAPKNLFQMILKAYERSSFLGCSIEPDPNVVEAETPMGLIRGHAYSITDVKLVDIETPRVKGKIPLLRIRNPWGNEAEWKGAWSDGSPEWSYINDDTKEEIGLTFDADGEFWMSFKDFQTYFDRLEICNLSPDDLAVDDLPGKKKWNMNVYEGAWIRGATAGGCRNYLETFAHNPQYIIDLEDPDEDDDESKCTVIVALMQKNRRAQRKLGMDCLTIGFAIYSLTGDNIQSPLPVKFFKYNASIARSPTFINLREVCSRFKLDPGKYVVVPSTFEPNEEGEFIIRVFSEGPNSMTENDSDVGIGEIDDKIKGAGDSSGNADDGFSNSGGSDKVKETEPEEAEAAERVQQFFKTVAGDDMGIDWSELKEVLDLALKREFAFEGFSREVCRSMVAMMDIDRSGKLGLDEFVSLWKSIRTWKSVFKIYDHDNSGHLSSFELRQALTSAGYHVNNKVLESLVLRYGDPQGQVMFDDFIMCAVKLKCMIEIYREKEVAGDRSVNFTLEEWVEKTLYS